MATRSAAYVGACVIAFAAACRTRPELGLRESSSPCHLKPDSSVIHVSLPGRAFSAVSSVDGCWVFVSTHSGPDSAASGLAVVARSGGRATLARFLPHPAVTSRTPQTFGLALTHNGEILVVAAADRITFYDVGRLTSGSAEPLLGELRQEGRPTQFFHASLTADDHLLFVSNHAQEEIAVIDFAEARRSGYRRVPVVGTIPVGWGPGSVTLSPDGRYLFVTTQIADDTWGWPKVCLPPGASAGATPSHLRGAVHVVDVARAAVDPSHSTIGIVSAGCDPLQLAVSQDGSRAYVTVRSDSVMLTFDTHRIVSDSAHALIASTRTHAGPNGIVVFDAGRRIAVGNYLRFTAAVSDTEFVAVIDASSIRNRSHAVVNHVQSGGGPIDLSLTPDGRTLLVANYEPRSLTLIPIRLLR